MDSKMRSSTDKSVFRFRQSNVWQLLPAFDCLNCARQFDYCVLNSSRKLGGAAKQLIDGSEKCICRFSFEF